MDSRALDIFAIMTTSTHPSGQFQRQIFLQSKENAQAALQSFVKLAGHKLDLQSISGSDVLEVEGSNKADQVFNELSDNVEKQRKAGDSKADDEVSALWNCTWKQGNVAASRKQVAPLLREAARSVQHPHD